MNRCTEFRGDIAAALYEPLEPDVQARLDAHLESCTACRAEASALQKLVSQLPNNVPEFTGDLLPVLSEEIRNTSTRSPFTWRLWAPLGIAALLILGVYLNLRSTPTVQPPSETINIADTTPAQSISEKAYTLAQAGEFAAARTLLREALDKELGDAGVLLEALGDIEFDHGQRYAQAFDAYDALKREHPEQWVASSAIVKNRYDLLAEVRSDNYEPLLRLDAASTFEGYETVLARYPEHQMVASLAVARMESVLGTSDGSDPDTRVAALEAVRERCTEPLAVAQLSISLGDIYWKELDDLVRARELYEDATSAPHVALAQRAKDSLSTLDNSIQP